VTPKRQSGGVRRPPAVPSSLCAIPKKLFVTFRKESGERCCSFESMKELREAHPASRYDVVVYIPRITRPSARIR
jgi:hypothetical protein